MTKTDRPLSFDLRNPKRSTSEEVSVGAYAKRQSRRRLLLGIFGAVLTIGALTLYGFLKPPGQTTQDDKYAVSVRCAACNHTAIVNVRFDQTFPMRCPACKEQAAQVMWQCRQCEHLFVPEQRGTAVSCPNCGSENVGSAARP